MVEFELLLDVDPEFEVLLIPADTPTLVSPTFDPLETVVELLPEVLLTPEVEVSEVVFVTEVVYILPFRPSAVLQGAPAPCREFTILFASGLWAKQLKENITAANNKTFFISIVYGGLAALLTIVKQKEAWTAMPRLYG